MKYTRKCLASLSRNTARKEKQVEKHGMLLGNAKLFALHANSKRIKEINTHTHARKKKTLHCDLIVIYSHVFQNSIDLKYKQKIDF